MERDTRKIKCVKCKQDKPLTQYTDTREKTCIECKRKARKS